MPVELEGRGEPVDQEDEVKQGNWTEPADKGGGRELGETRGGGRANELDRVKEKGQDRQRRNFRSGFHGGN